MGWVAAAPVLVAGGGGSPVAAPRWLGAVPVVAGCRETWEAGGRVKQVVGVSKTRCGGADQGEEEVRRPRPGGRGGAAMAQGECAAGGRWRVVEMWGGVGIWQGRSPGVGWPLVGCWPWSGWGLGAVGKKLRVGRGASRPGSAAGRPAGVVAGPEPPPVGVLRVERGKEVGREFLFIDPQNIHPFRSESQPDISLTGLLTSRP